MAERDRFERDLGTALNAYAEDAPMQVRPTELARHFATAYPHGRTAIGRWGLVAVPRRAWALLLLAALLAAMVGGMNLVGSPMLRRLLAVVPPVGQVFECPPGSTPDEPGPADQARPLAIPHLSMAFDRRAGRLVALVDVDDSVETWTFDVCTNTWTLMQSGSGPDTGLALVYDPGADLIIGVDYPEDPVTSPPHAWAYSVADNTWTRKGRAPDHVARLSYDVASAQVAAWAAHEDHDPGTIWAYDVAADTWAMVGALEFLGGFPWGNPGDDLLAYDASLDRVVATVVDGSETRLFDMRTGSVADARAAAPWAGQCGFMSGRFCYGGPAGAAIAYDERTQRTVVLIGGHAFAYNATADRWDTLFEPAGTGPGELARAGHPMAYDPVNRRLVVLAGDFDGDPDPVEAVLAFDTTTREWTILLEPSRVQPSPSP